MPDELHPFEVLLRQRIVVLDGAMGTTLQRLHLSEADYRGERFATHSVDLKNNNEALNIVRPEIIENIHRAYFDAGADIIETNTFSSTAIAQSDYGLESSAYDLNLAGARLASST